MNAQEAADNNYKCPECATWLKESRKIYYCPKCMFERIGNDPIRKE
jgi:DNA primase large subunit